MRKCELTIEGLCAYRAIDKLAAAGTPVLAAEKVRKNAVTVWVNGKDRKKVFAILQGSCYNIKKVRFRGFERVKAECIKSAGLLVGAVFFLCAVAFAQGRVLRVEIAGSGAYYAEEVKEILSLGGVKRFSSVPKDTAMLSAQILSLPRVSFCSLKLSGGVLTVNVEVSDENALLEGKPLLAPCDGVVEELVVVRGTALAEVGSSVKKGDVIVANSASGEGGTRPVIVIARVKIGFPVAAEYALTEAQALAQAYLDYGEITEIHTTKTENGWLVEGAGHAETAINLG